jgi:hypothetical protein
MCKALYRSRAYVNAGLPTDIPDDPNQSSGSESAPDRRDVVNGTTSQVNGPTNRYVRFRLSFPRMPVSWFPACGSSTIGHAMQEVRHEDTCLHEIHYFPSVYYIIA